MASTKGLGNRIDKRTINPKLHHTEVTQYSPSYGPNLTYTKDVL